MDHKKFGKIVRENSNPNLHQFLVGDLDLHSPNKQFIFGNNLHSNSPILEGKFAPRHSFIHSLSILHTNLASRYSVFEATCLQCLWHRLTELILLEGESILTEFTFVDLPAQQRPTKIHDLLHNNCMFPCHGIQ